MGVAVGIAIFLFRFGDSQGPPLFLACFAVKRNDITVRRLARQISAGILDRHGDGVIAAEDRTIGMSPPDGEVAIFFLHIQLPELVAIEIIGGQVAVAEMDEDHFAIGRAGGAGQVVFGMEELVSTSFSVLCRPERIVKLCLAQLPWSTQFFHFAY